MVRQEPDQPGCLLQPWYVHTVHTNCTILKIHTYTVKLVHNDHSRDPVIVVSVDRWSLYRGALVQLKWTMNQPTMVSIDRWSLYGSDL